jgi:hypothetical protein
MEQYALRLDLDECYAFGYTYGNYNIYCRSVKWNL